ncbi:hypothetical protein B566_EDAN004690 [Ephemera danica]|nr:hypothetical protein B566_EDAN004690 [Ephemera danica]
MNITFIVASYISNAIFITHILLTIFAHPLQISTLLENVWCGKLFKAQLEVEFHAGKTGHSSFSESTEEKRPLTEEEKQEQLRKVEEKLKQKRLERAEQEKAEAVERERIRIKSGKEMIAAKKRQVVHCRLEEDEMKKLVEQRRREKIEEQEARQRIKAKIEQDKIARRAKFGMPNPDGSDQAAVPVNPKPAAAPVQIAPPKDYSQTKINHMTETLSVCDAKVGLLFIERLEHMRLTNGQTLSQTFGAKEELSAVRLYVEMHRTDPPGPFSLMTSFPKKVFTADDYEKPLDALGKCLVLTNILYTA